MMRALAERAYFLLCLALGWLLRSGRYSKARIVYKDGDPSTLREPQGRPEHGRGTTRSGSSRAWSRDECQVRKYRRFYAPLLIWMSGPLVSILDTGVRVLPQRDWEERERLIYRSLRGASIRIETDGTLVLPCLAGKTLASLLEDPQLEVAVRTKAIEHAVLALAELHHRGFTHGDAMAENVLVDLAPRRGSGRPEHSSQGEAGVAHWIDFETIHESSRPQDWRYADDVRALLVTCLIRTVPEKRAETLQLILDVYSDENVTRLLPTSFTVFRRPLAFHLAQAGLSFACFREIARISHNAHFSVKTLTGPRGDHPASRRQAPVARRTLDG